MVRKNIERDQFKVLGGKEHWSVLKGLKQPGLRSDFSKAKNIPYR